MNDPSSSVKLEIWKLQIPPHQTLLNGSTDTSSVWMQFFLLILFLAMLLQAVCSNDKLYLTSLQGRENIMCSYVNTNCRNYTIQSSTLDLPFSFCKKNIKPSLKSHPKRKSLKIGYKLPFLREAFKEAQKQTQDRNAIIHQEGSKNYSWFTDRSLKCPWISTIIHHNSY